MTAQNILFNDGWQFCLCDIGTELSALPGRHWYDVELPHDWRGLVQAFPPLLCGTAFGQGAAQF